MPEARYDVIIATDVRLPGGTTASAAEEIVAQHAAGYRTGLLHVPSSLSAEPRPMTSRLQALVDADRCELITGTSATAEVLVFRHPRVAQELDPRQIPSVHVGRVTMVANQAPTSPDGSETHFDPLTAHERLSSWAGMAANWAPIGPLVRDNLRRAAPTLPVVDDDWVNIIDTRAWHVERVGPRSPVRIGRHSRDHALKWPATREALLQAYPEHLDVRVLGGARTPRELLGGRLPPSWTVYRFDEIPVLRFLAELDVFVYQHHPAWVEAFGRTIIEALAAGLPVVLPEQFRPLFGEVPRYADPAGTTEAVDELTRDRDHYLDVSARGRNLVEERFSHRTHEARIEALIGAPKVGGVSRAGVAEDARPATRRRALLVSSNGAGVGHLMRLMAIARRLPPVVEPVFLTLSQAIGVVRQLGFHVEYLPSRGALDAPHALWHDLLERRMLSLIDDLGIEVVVFDGTWPYNGLLAALERRPSVRSIWSRRGMWRADVTKHKLELTDRFTSVLEPGELAEDADRGPTSRRRHEAVQVGPITFLRDEEALPRDEALQELGLDADHGQRVALVQLGAGNINDTTSTLGEVVRLLREHDPEVLVCVTRSAIADADALPDGVHPISTYPLSRVFAAFDVAIAASGYNTFHELLIAGVPTAFLPNLETATDDQLARARWAEEAGFAVRLRGDDLSALAAGVEELLASGPTIRNKLEQDLQRLDGAQQAADHVAELAASQQPGAPSDEQPGSRSGTRGGSGLKATGYRVARAVYRQLPPQARRALLRAKGGMTYKPTALPRDRDPVPIPPGRGADSSTGAAEPDPMLIWLRGFDDQPTLEAALSHVTTLQRMTGAFVPMFLTSSPDLKPFRSAGYGVEVLPDVGTLTDMVGEVAARRILAERLSEIRHSYGVEHVIALRDDDLAGPVSPLRAAL